MAKFENLVIDYGDKCSQWRSGACSLDDVFRAERAVLDAYAKLEARVKELEQLPGARISDLTYIAEALGSSDWVGDGVTVDDLLQSLKEHPSPLVREGADYGIQERSRRRKSLESE